MMRAFVFAISSCASEVFPGDRQYWEGTQFAIDLPKTTIASLLPIGLEPAEVPGCTDNSTHPLTLQFVTQYHVGSPFTNFNYKEVTVTVPYVQWDELHADRWEYYRGPFAYDVKLYLNETMPVRLGRKYVGDNKEFAYIGESLDLDGSGTMVVVGTDWGPFNGEVIIEASWKTQGPMQLAKDKYPQVAGKDPIPGIGHYPSDDDTAPWECLPSADHSDDALVSPATGKMTIHQSFKKGIPTGTFNFTALDTAGRGAYRMKTKWGYANLPLHPFKTDCKTYNPDDWHGQMLV